MATVALSAVTITNTNGQPIATVTDFQSEGSDGAVTTYTPWVGTDGISTFMTEFTTYVTGVPTTVHQSIGNITGGVSTRHITYIAGASTITTSVLVDQAGQTTAISQTASSSSTTSTQSTVTTATTTTGTSTRGYTSGPSSPVSTISSSRTSTSTGTGHTNTPGIHSGDGVSNGALAGAVVGSIIGSALLTLFIVFFFFRRRRQQPSPKGVDSESRSTPGYGVASANSVLYEKSVSGFSLAAIVPQPADDEAVRGRILTLVDQAALHIDNYYPPSSSPPHLSHDAIALVDKYDSEYLPAPLVTMLGQRGIQRQVLSHVLVQTLLDAIHPQGKLLPALFAAHPQVKSPDTSTDNALFAWRMLSAHLYQRAQYSHDPLHIASRASAARVLAADFTHAFAPYSVPMFSEADRLDHLTNLAKATADLGIWLFSQPCTFDFIWSEGNGEFAVVPRIVKTSDEQGRRLASAQVLVEQVTTIY